MPLSTPSKRQKLHTRTITVEGFLREDGLYDVEAHLVDTKTRGVVLDDRGYLPPGEPLHEMWMRMTINEELVIVRCEASTEAGPYGICPEAAPNFSRLEGLDIRRGFLKAAAERVGGVIGCTHLRELLQQMATTALQTMFSKRVRRELRADRPPTLLNTCYAWASTSPVIKRRWPQFYTGPDAEREKDHEKASAREKEAALGD